MINQSEVGGWGLEKRGVVVKLKTWGRVHRGVMNVGELRWRGESGGQRSLS